MLPHSDLSFRLFYPFPDGVRGYLGICVGAGRGASPPGPAGPSGPQAQVGTLTWTHEEAAEACQPGVPGKLQLLAEMRSPFAEGTWGMGKRPGLEPHSALH